MKRFIIISLMAVMSLPMLACAWPDTHNHYLFRVCQGEEFSERMDKITRKNWQAYLGNTDEYYWYNADEIISFARKKGDELMVGYVENLERYLKQVQEVRAEAWDYPSRQDVTTRNQRLSDIRAYAKSKLKTKLRSQHALLFMRCNMLMGRHQENVTFWEQTASQYIETVYKDMMKNIYAGALYKTGRQEEAGRIFAEQHDYNSLMTQYYKKRSFEAIRQEYQRDANSPVLYFLLQDFVNNAQEAIDATSEEGGLSGKLFIRDIKRSEAQQMWQFAAQVVREGKTQDPALWKSAEAWLQYLFGNQRQGKAAIDEAMTLDGTQASKDVARTINIYITSATTPVGQSFDDYLAGELQWLTTDTDNGLKQVALDRLIHQVLVKKYKAAGRDNTALALYKSVGAYQYDNMIDTMRVDKLITFLDYATTNHRSPLDNYLKQYCSIDETDMNDFIATKYLRLAEWQKALDWFQKVPQSFYRDLHYAVWAIKRSWAVEPWVKRQWLTQADYEQEYHLNNNPKADFCREMLRMEGELSVLSGEERHKRCYDLAVRYAQAHYTGDCWYLTRGGKSGYDELQPNELDFIDKAVSYLAIAGQTKNMKLQERVLFAQSYVYLNPDRWFTEEWNDAENCSFLKPQPQTWQYKCLARLADFEKANGSHIADYVTMCDEYVTFINNYK